MRSAGQGDLGATRLDSVVDVPTGEVATTRGGALAVSALGSCVAVIALDVEEQVGGVAHIMLPGAAPLTHRGQETKWAREALLALLWCLDEVGARRDALQFFLLGGGNVLRRDDDTVCSANIESVTGLMSDLGLSVTDSDLGGDVRRSCVLDTQNGCVLYTSGDSPRRVLWKKERPHG